MGIEAFHGGGISPSGERSRYAIRFRFLPLPFPLSPLPSFLSSPISSNRRRTRLVEIKSDWKKKKKRNTRLAAFTTYSRCFEDRICTGDRGEGERGDIPSPVRRRIYLGGRGIDTRL